MAAARAWRTGLPALVLASILAANARAEDTLAGVCTPDELTMFACVLKSRQQVGFCLSKAQLKMRLVVRADASQASSPMRGLREAAIGGNAHGDIIALRGNTEDGSVALYVDFIPDDLVAPVLIMESGKQEIKEPCASAGFKTDNAEVSVGGIMRVARLVGLVDIGVAKPMTPAPDWPE